MIKVHVAIATAVLLAQSGLTEGTEAEAPLAWRQSPDTIYQVDGADAGNSADFFSFSRLIKVSGGTGPILILNCQAMSNGAHSLNAGIQLDPANTYEENPAERLHLHRITVTMSVDGKRTHEKFMMHPKSSKIVPIDKSVGKRLFNAAVTGAVVTIKANGKTFELEIPDQDKVFADFAKTCPTTNGGKFYNTLFESPDASN